MRGGQPKSKAQYYALPWPAVKSGWLKEPKKKFPSSPSALTKWSPHQRSRCSSLPGGGITQTSQPHSPMRTRGSIWIYLLSYGTQLFFFKFPISATSRYFSRFLFVWWWGKGWQVLFFSTDPCISIFCFFSLHHPIAKKYFSLFGLLFLP